MTVLDERERLRVLIANERLDRLATVARVLTALGYDVVAREIEVAAVSGAIAAKLPDVALVGLGESPDHALGLIREVVGAATCPVIALIHASDPAFLREASKLGIYAYVRVADNADWQSSIDIVLRRWADYRDLRGAFGRRAITERAKGILMERHAIDEANAFEMLRERSRAGNRRLVEVAGAVVAGHLLLPRHPGAQAAG